MNCLFCTYTIEETSNSMIHAIDGESYSCHADCMSREEFETQLWKPTYVVTVWDVGRAHGGNEEGGWSYEYGDLVDSIELTSKEAAEAVAEALTIEYPSTGKRNSVLGGEDHEVKVLSRDDEWDLKYQFDPRLDLIDYYPVTTPRYE